MQHRSPLDDFNSQTDANKIQWVRDHLKTADQFWQFVLAMPSTDDFQQLIAIIALLSDKRLTSWFASVNREESRFGHFCHEVIQQNTRLTQLFSPVHFYLATIHVANHVSDSRESFQSWLSRLHLGQSVGQIVRVYLGSIVASIQNNKITKQNLVSLSMLLAHKNTYQEFILPGYAIRALLNQFKDDDYFLVEIIQAISACEKLWDKTWQEYAPNLNELAVLHPYLANKLHQRWIDQVLPSESRLTLASCRRFVGYEVNRSPLATIFGEIVNWTEFRDEEILREKLRARIHLVLRHSDPEILLSCAVQDITARNYLKQFIALPDCTTVRENCKAIIAKLKVTELIELYAAFPVLFEMITEVLNERARTQLIDVLSELKPVRSTELFQAVEAAMSSKQWLALLESVFFEAEDAELQRRLDLFEPDSLVLTQKVHEAVQMSEKRLFYAVYFFVAADARPEFLRKNAVLARGYATTHALTVDDFYAFAVAGVLPMLNMLSNENTSAIFDGNIEAILTIMLRDGDAIPDLARFIDSLIDIQFKGRMHQMSRYWREFFSEVIFAKLNAYPNTQQLCIQLLEFDQNLLLESVADQRFNQAVAQMLKNGLFILLNRGDSLTLLRPALQIKLLTCGNVEIEKRVTDRLKENKSSVRGILSSASFQPDLLDRHHAVFADFIQKSNKIRSHRLAVLFGNQALRQLVLGRYQLFGSVMTAAQDNIITLHEDDLTAILANWPANVTFDASDIWIRRFSHCVADAVAQLMKAEDFAADHASSSTSSQMARDFVIHILRSASMTRLLLADLTVAQYQAIIVVANEVALANLFPFAIASSHPFVAFLRSDKVYFLRQNIDFQAFAIKHLVLSHVALKRLNAVTTLNLLKLNDPVITQAIIHFENAKNLAKLSTSQIRIACRVNQYIFRFFCNDFLATQTRGILPEDVYYAAARFNDVDIRMSDEMSRWMDVATIGNDFARLLSKRFVSPVKIRVSKSGVSNQIKLTNEPAVVFKELKRDRFQKRLKKMNNDPLRLTDMFDKKSDFFCSNVTEIWSSDVVRDAAMIMLAKKRNMDESGRLTLAPYTKQLLEFIHSKPVCRVFSAKPTATKSGLFGKVIKSTDVAMQEIQNARKNIANLQQAYLDLFIHFNDATYYAEFTRVLLDVMNSNDLNADDQREQEGVTRVRELITTYSRDDAQCRYMLTAIQSYYETALLENRLSQHDDHFGILDLLALTLKELGSIKLAIKMKEFSELAMALLRSKVLVESNKDLPIQLITLLPELIDFWLIYPHLYQLLKPFDQLKSIVAQQAGVGADLDDNAVMSFLFNEPLYCAGVAKYAGELLQRKNKAAAVAARRDSYLSQGRRHGFSTKDGNLDQLQAEIEQLKERLNSSPALSGKITSDMIVQTASSTSQSEPSIVIDSFATTFALPPPPPPLPGQTTAKKAGVVQSAASSEVIVLSTEEKQLQEHDSTVSKIILQMLSKLNAVDAKQQSSIVIKRIAQAVFGFLPIQHEPPTPLEGEEAYTAALKQLLSLKVRRPFMKKVTELFDPKCHDLSDQATVYRLLCYAINPAADADRDTVATSLKMELGKKLLINDAKYLKLRNEKGEDGAIAVMLLEYYVGKVIDFIFTKRNHEGIKQLNTLKSDLLDSVKREMTSSSTTQAKSSPKLFTSNDPSRVFNPSDITQVTLRRTVKPVEPPTSDLRPQDPRNSLLMAIQGFKRDSLKKSNDQESQAMENELKIRNS
jgi:hypothetical protein